MATQKLASDLDNPEFVGAKNPDSALAVLFYRKAVQNEFLSEGAGRPIFDDVDFVKIFVPGDNLSVIDRPVREDDKRRFKQYWTHYIEKREGDQMMSGRTPLSAWPRLTVGQVETLRGLKFFSVDDVANASDMALQSVGMAAGMAPHAFREAAQRFLQLAASDAKESVAEGKVKELETQNAALSENMAKLQKQMASLMERLTAVPVHEATAPAEPARRGKAEKV